MKGSKAIAKSLYLPICKKMANVTHGTARVGNLGVNFDKFTYPIAANRLKHDPSDSPHNGSDSTDNTNVTAVVERDPVVEAQSELNSTRTTDEPGRSGRGESLTFVVPDEDPTNKVTSRSVFICYSGLLRGFGTTDAAVNHVERFVKPLRLSPVLGISELVVAFSLTNQEVLPPVVHAMFSRSNVSTKVITAQISPSVIENDQRGQLHPQFFGIEHCGRLITSAETARKRAFDFAVRMRYDIYFRDGPLGSFGKLVPAWPIWYTEKVNMDVALFGKHGHRSENELRCLPQVRRIQRRLAVAAPPFVY